MNLLPDPLEILGLTKHHRLKKGEVKTPLSSKLRGAVEVPGPSPLPSLLAVRLEAAENEWTLLPFSASHMDFVTLPNVRNKLI